RLLPHVNRYILAGAADSKSPHSLPAAKSKNILRVSAFASLKLVVDRPLNLRSDHPEPSIAVVMRIAVVSHRCRMRLRTLVAAGVMLAAALCSTRTATAVGVLLDSHGFEGAAYTPGLLDDQDSWRHVRSPDPGSLGTAVVQTGGGSPTGAKSILVSRG